MKKIYLSIALLLMVNIFTFSNNAHADAAPGDIIVALGEDLTISQKKEILKEMGVEESDVQIVTITNEEEHNYLGEYIPAAQIGTKAISSAIIKVGEVGDGLTIQLNNINFISEEMYGNALGTAGVTDAEIYITAPFGVSGTGALTGIMKAYEVTSGESIDEETKQVANEEMVLTAELAEDQGIGNEQAVNFINNIKNEIAEQNPQNAEEVRSLIERLSIEMGVSLTEEQLNDLVSLFDKFKNLDINWDKVNQSVNTAKEKVTDFVQSEEGQNFVEKVKDFFVSLWNFISSLFSK